MQHIISWAQCRLLVAAFFASAAGPTGCPVVGRGLIQLRYCICGSACHSMGSVLFMVTSLCFFHAGLCGCDDNHRQLVRFVLLWAHLVGHVLTTAVAKMPQFIVGIEIAFVSVCMRYPSLHSLLITCKLCIAHSVFYAFAFCV